LTLRHSEVYAIIVNISERISANVRPPLETPILAPSGNYPTPAEETKSVSELRDSERLLRASMEHSPIGMALTRMNGSWIDVNPALCEFLGYSKAELMEAGFKNVTLPEDREATVQTARQMVASGQKSIRLEKRYIHSSGRIVVGMLHLTVVRDENDVPIMYISQIADVTAVRQLEHLKSEFITTVNHELRTPVTGITGALRLLEVLAGNSLSEKAQGLVTVAARNAARLKSLLDDILEMESVVTDQSFWSPQDQDMSEALTLAMSATAAKSAAAGIPIRFLTPIDPVICPTHPERLGRVLRILLSNAVKYSDEGGEVTVNIGSTADAVRVMVENSGLPIPEEMRAHIFKPFVQGESTDIRRKQGSGMGLAIAHHLVTSIGGQIDFLSTEHSTRFWIDIPKKRQ
jgi:PAS domain S-box-containing protein